jgi:hypothetical protein
MAFELGRQLPLLGSRCRDCLSYGAAPAALATQSGLRRHEKFTLRANRAGQAVTSASVLIGSARGGRIAGPVAAGVAVVVMGLAGCTAVTGGGATVNAVDAPAYRTSMSASSSQSAASSSARESERQASLTTAALRSSCETLSSTSADAIDAVNAYVSAFNEEGGDITDTEGPAVDGLNQSAEAVDGSISDVMPQELQDAFAAWVNGAQTAADAINSQASPSEFNQIIGELNDARSAALSLCDATY